MIPSSRLLLTDVFLLQTFISNRIVTIKILDCFWCLYCRVISVFKHTNLKCAQSRSVTVLEWKTDPASKSRSSRKGLKDNDIRLLGNFNVLCIPFGTESTIPTCGVLDSACTVVTLHRFANFRVMHLISDIELPRRVIILLLLLSILLVLIFSYRFLVK